MKGFMSKSRSFLRVLAAASLVLLTILATSALGQQPQRPGLPTVNRGDTSGDASNQTSPKVGPDVIFAADED